MGTWPPTVQFTAPFADFSNPYSIEDIATFDNQTLKRLIQELDINSLALALASASGSLKRRVLALLPFDKQSQFQSNSLNTNEEAISLARTQILDTLFWHLTFWLNPEGYYDLTEGEYLHPGIFQQLGPSLVGKDIADIGAGWGRATFECLNQSAKTVYAIDPVPALLEIMRQRLINEGKADRVIIQQGSFNEIPLENNTVNIALSCSSFLATEANGGETGLSELKRITKPGGKIIMIWPHPGDYNWLAERGFEYVSFKPIEGAMVTFRSMQVALKCVDLFYTKRSQFIKDYLAVHKTPEIPFSLLGLNQPNDYCWLQVKK